MKKGVALIWVLILSTVLIIISSTMVSYIIKDSRFSVQIEESSRVYAAAKSGIDWASWYLTENDITTTKTYTFDIINTGDGAETTVVVTPLSNGTDQIESTSVLNNVTRKLKYITSSNPGAPVTPTGVVNETSAGPNSESFDLQFDLWTRSDHPFSFGLQNASNGSRLFARLDSATGQLVLSKTLAGITSSTPGIFNIYGDINSNTPYVYRINIKYIKATAAQLTIRRREALSGNYSCIGTSNLDLTGMAFGDLSNLYAATSNGTVSYETSGAEGDGSYVLVKSSTSSYGNYIDNIYIKK